MLIDNEIGLQKFCEVQSTGVAPEFLRVLLLCDDCDELEITNLSRMYLGASSLDVMTLNRGHGQLTVGTMDSLYEIGWSVRPMQPAQGLSVNMLEEIAYENEWIVHIQL